MESNQSAILRKYIIWIVLLIVGFLVTLFVSNHGFIEVNVTGTNSQLSYKILDQSNQKTTEIKTTSSKLKKFVGKGNYEVLVTNNDTSSLLVVKTKGFLGKTTVSTKLTQEKDRQFVGNNPGECMYYTGGILYSYSCHDSFSNISMHVPATVTQPTYTSKNSANNHSPIEGITNTRNGLITLLHTINDGDNSTSTQTHTVYTLSDGANLSGGTPLPDLNADKSYSVKPYKEGFIAYNSSSGEAKYYSAFTAKPQTISIAGPKDSSLKPYLMGTNGESVFVVYSDKAGFQVNDNPSAIGKVKSEISVYNNGQTKHFTLNRQYGSIELCGTNKLCLLDNVQTRTSQLIIDDIGGSTAKHLYSVGGVNNIISLSTGLLAVRDNGIYNLNVDAYSGFIDYSFGDYKYCGIQTDLNSYLLCLTNSKSRNIALRIDETSLKNSSIDKKVAGLQKTPNVTDVSAYGRYILILPDFGPLFYNSSTKIYDYAPATKAAITKQINAAVDQEGIDRNSYSIVINGAQ